MLVLTPDTLFIRLSEMGPLEIIVWRGLEIGFIMFTLSYLLDRKNFGKTLKLTYSPAVWQHQPVSLSVRLPL